MATVVVPRPETAQQWARALERALTDGLDVLIEPISGEAFVESATRPGTLYAVSATTCSCKAGANGSPCKHRACYLAVMGEMPFFDPSPAAPQLRVAVGRLTTDVPWSEGSDDLRREQEADAREVEASLPVIDCPDCCGCGVIVCRSIEQPCDVCGGAGVLAA